MAKRSYPSKTEILQFQGLLLFTVFCLEQKSKLNTTKALLLQQPLLNTSSRRNFASPGQRRSHLGSWAQDSWLKSSPRGSTCK